MDERWLGRSNHTKLPVAAFAQGVVPPLLRCTPRNSPQTSSQADAPVLRTWRLAVRGKCPSEPRCLSELAAWCWHLVCTDSHAHFRRTNDAGGTPHSIDANARWCELRIPRRTYLVHLKSMCKRDGTVQLATFHSLCDPLLLCRTVCRTASRQACSWSPTKTSTLAWDPWSLGVLWLPRESFSFSSVCLGG